MPSASLNNMTVPLASDQSASSQGLLMPKLKYRFRVSFENFGPQSATPPTELTKQVISFTRPNLTFEEIALPIYNSTLKLAGRHSWAQQLCAVFRTAVHVVSLRREHTHGAAARRLGGFALYPQRQRDGAVGHVGA